MMRISLFCGCGLLSVLVCGCMTSRSRCEVAFENAKTAISSAAEVNTKQKYRIREIRAGAAAYALEDAVMGKVVGSLNSVQRIMHTCPGVFEREGTEVFVDILSHQRTKSHCWTAIPCLLTVGICPYFQRDDTIVSAEVSLVSDPSKKARFTYREIDDWKISFLFQLGWIPYSDGVLSKSRICKRGRGDITDEVHREGLAVGVAKALGEIERKR